MIHGSGAAHFLRATWTEWSLTSEDPVPADRKRPPPGQPHILEADQDGFCVCHTSECLDRPGGEPVCDVAYAQDWGPEYTGDPGWEGLVPGEYWIILRFAGEYEEAEWWLELMYPEEVSGGE